MASLLFISDAATARILKTKKPVSALDRILIGSGFEYTPDPINPEYVLTGVTEYKLTNRIKLGFETDYATITCATTPTNPAKSCGAASGIGDLETSAEWELIPERRYRPSVAVLGVVKFPTKNPFGTGLTNVDIGAIVGKEFVHWQVEGNAIYTFVGSHPRRPRQNMLELSASAEYHINRHWDLEGEVVWSKGGDFASRKGSSGSGGNNPQTQATIGFAQYPNDFLKFEEGVTAQSDGTKTIVIGWEYEFGGH